MQRRTKNDYYDAGDAYLRQRKYDQSIAVYNEAIRCAEKDGVNDVTGYYNNRAVAYYDNLEFGKALLDFIHLRNISTYPSSALDCHLNRIDVMLSTLENEHRNALKDIEKSDLFELIKLLPEDRKIFHLLRCLDPSTVLGKKMREKAFFSADTLNDICNYLIKIDPLYQLTINQFITPISVSTSISNAIASFFSPEVSKQEEITTLLKRKDHHPL